jgi:hypothetical protein
MLVDHVPEPCNPFVKSFTCLCGEEKDLCHRIAAMDPLYDGLIIEA